MKKVLDAAITFALLWWCLYAVVIGLAALEALWNAQP